MEDYKLSRDAKKILKSVAESGQSSLTLEEIATTAGVGLAVVRREVQNENFRSLLFETLKGGMTNAAPAVVSALTEGALSGSIKHQTLFLELIGMYEKKQSAKVELGILTSEANPFRDDDKRREFILKTLNKFVEEE